MSRGSEWRNWRKRKEHMSCEKEKWNDIQCRKKKEEKIFCWKSFRVSEIIFLLSFFVEGETCQIWSQMVKLSYDKTISRSQTWISNSSHFFSNIFLFCFLFFDLFIYLMYIQFQRARKYFRYLVAPFNHKLRSEAGMPDEWYVGMERK